MYKVKNIIMIAKLLQNEPVFSLAELLRQLSGTPGFRGTQFEKHTIGAA
jgi:hypothetical protein